MTRKGLIVAALFVFGAGVVAGGVCVAWLSSRASHLHMQMVRLSLASGQRDLTTKAWREGDFESALTHAACAVEMEKWGRTGFPATPRWDVTFPMMGFFSDERTRYPVDDFSVLEAQAHARFGAVLERIGQIDGAHREYDRATKLVGKSAPDRWRTLGLQELEAAQRAPQ